MACLFVLLAGIVFFNVSVLELNEGIARTSKRSDEFKRQNSRLRLEVARLESSERIQRAAAELGLMLPAAGDVRYVSTRPRTDARRAARRMRAPQAPAFAVAPAGQTGEAPGGPQAPARTQAPGEGQAPTGTAQVGGTTPADDAATVNGQAPAPAGTAPSPPAAAAP